jgi:hypothetical protein
MQKDEILKHWNSSRESILQDIEVAHEMQNMWVVGTTVTGYRTVP